jgi:hypothetical protein
VTPRPAPIFPPDRYGRRRGERRAPRWIPLAVTAAAVLVALWLSLHLYQQYGTDNYQADIVRYGEVTATGVSVTFTVSKPADRQARCRLQAVDAHSVEVGYAEVQVGAGASVTTTYTVPTKSRAAGVTILGCDAIPR